MAGRSHAVTRAINAPATSLLGVSVPDIRVADPRSYGRRLDSHAEAEGAVAEYDGASEAHTSKVSVWASPDATDAALLRHACAQSTQASAEVCDVQASTTALLQKTATLPLLCGRNNPLTEIISTIT